MRGPREAFVRVRGMRVCGYRGRLHYKLTDSTIHYMYDIILSVARARDGRTRPCLPARSSSLMSAGGAAGRTEGRCVWGVCENLLHY